MSAERPLPSYQRSTAPPLGCKSDHVATRKRGTLVDRALRHKPLDPVLVSVELVELLHSVEDGLFGGFLHLARKEELVQDHVNLVEVEHEV